jgi:hypothetical protein
MNTPFSPRGRHQSRHHKRAEEIIAGAGGLPEPLPAPVAPATPVEQLNAAVTDPIEDEPGEPEGGPAAAEAAEPHAWVVTLRPGRPHLRHALTGDVRFVRHRTDGSGRVYAAVRLGEDESGPFIIETGDPEVAAAMAAAWLQVRDALVPPALPPGFAPTGRTVEVDGLADAGEVHG